MELAPAAASSEPATDGAVTTHLGLGRRHRRLRFTGIIAHRAPLLAAFAFLAIAAGGILHAAGHGAAGDDIWRAAVAFLAAELAIEVAHTLVVDRHMGVDTIALVAMIGSLPMGQELAGAVVGVMFSGGAALEDIASTRAR